MKISVQNESKFDAVKLKNLRIAKGLTLQSLANEIGVSHNTIWEIEKNKNRVVSCELIFRYCAFFEVTILELMTDKFAIQCAENMSSYLEFHGVIDNGTSKSIIEFYSTQKD